MGNVLLSVLINLVVLLVVFLIFRVRIKRLLNGSEFLDTIRDEVNHLVVDLNQNADRNIGILEERISRLQKLIGDADKKILLLGKEREKMNISVDVYDRLKRSAPLVPVSSVETPALDTPNSVAPDAAAPTAVTPNANTPNTDMPALGGEVPDTAEVAESTAAEEVLELYHRGFDPKLIAARTGSALGEVELIISLENGRR